MPLCCCALISVAAPSACLAQVWSSHAPLTKPCCLSEWRLYRARLVEKELAGAFESSSLHTQALESTGTGWLQVDEAPAFTDGCDEGSRGTWADTKDPGADAGAWQQKTRSVSDPHSTSDGTWQQQRNGSQQQQQQGCVNNTGCSRQGPQRPQPQASSSNNSNSRRSVRGKRQQEQRPQQPWNPINNAGMGDSSLQPPSSARFVDVDTAHGPTNSELLLSSHTHKWPSPSRPPRLGPGPGAWAHLLGHVEPGCLLLSRNRGPEMAFFDHAVLLITSHDEAKVSPTHP